MNKKNDNIDCEIAVEESLSSGDIEKAYDLLKEHVNKNQNSLTISSKGYVQSNGQYTAVGYVFSYNNNEVKLYKTVYKDNNLDSVEKIDKEIEKDEFINFYQSLYKNNHDILIARTMYSFKEKQKDTPEQIIKNQQKVALSLADKNIMIEDNKEQYLTVVDQEEIKINYTDQNILSLIDSYEDEDFDIVDD